MTKPLQTVVATHRREVTAKFLAMALVRQAAQIPTVYSRYQWLEK
jgi:hypothetical protein